MEIVNLKRYTCFDYARYISRDRRLLKGYFVVNGCQCEEKRLQRGYIGKSQNRVPVVERLACQSTDFLKVVRQGAY